MTNNNTNSNTITTDNNNNNNTRGNSNNRGNKYRGRGSYRGNNANRGNSNNNRGGSNNNRGNSNNCGNNKNRGNNNNNSRGNSNNRGRGNNNNTNSRGGSNNRANNNRRGRGRARGNRRNNSRGGNHSNNNSSRNSSYTNDSDDVSSNHSSAEHSTQATDESDNEYDVGNHQRLFFDSKSVEETVRDKEGNKYIWHGPAPVMGSTGGYQISPFNLDHEFKQWQQLEEHMDMAWPPAITSMWKGYDFLGSFQAMKLIEDDIKKWEDVLRRMCRFHLLGNYMKTIKLMSWTVSQLQYCRAIYPVMDAYRFDYDIREYYQSAKRQIDNKGPSYEQTLQLYNVMEFNAQADFSEYIDSLFINNSYYYKRVVTLQDKDVSAATSTTTKNTIEPPKSTLPFKKAKTDSPLATLSTTQQSNISPGAAVTSSTNKLPGATVAAIPNPPPATASAPPSHAPQASTAPPPSTPPQSSTITPSANLPQGTTVIAKTPAPTTTLTSTLPGQPQAATKAQNVTPASGSPSVTTPWSKPAGPSFMSFTPLPTVPASSTTFTPPTVRSATSTLVTVTQHPMVAKPSVQQPASLQAMSLPFGAPTPIPKLTSNWNVPPQPAQSHSAKPLSTQPQSAQPQTTPKPTPAQATQPLSMQPHSILKLVPTQSAQSQIAQVTQLQSSQSTQPQSNVMTVSAQSSQPQPSQPQTTQLQSAQSQLTQPQSSQPQLVTSRPGLPQPADPTTKPLVVSTSLITPYQQPTSVSTHYPSPMASTSPTQPSHPNYNSSLATTVAPSAASVAPQIPEKSFQPEVVHHEQQSTVPGRVSLDKDDADKIIGGLKGDVSSQDQMETPTTAKPDMAPSLQHHDRQPEPQLARVVNCARGDVGVSTILQDIKVWMEMEAKKQQDQATLLERLVVKNAVLESKLEEHASRMADEAKKQEAHRTKTHYWNMDISSLKERALEQDLKISQMESHFQSRMRRILEQDIVVARSELKDERVENLTKDLEIRRAEAMESMAKARAEMRDARQQVAEAREERAQAIERAARAEADNQMLRRVINELQGTGWRLPQAQPQEAGDQIRPSVATAALTTQAGLRIDAYRPHAHPRPSPFMRFGTTMRSSFSSSSTESLVEASAAVGRMEVISVKLENEFIRRLEVDPDKTEDDENRTDTDRDVTEEE
ncbi:hypothetical protein BGX29_003157 [Mortierella sp. GBA35]|nr:hypothetical protein BGX29_003157 [Mortierella sp. GBA35]